MTTTRSLSAVIVGAGLMGRWHADAARRAGAKVVGVVDLNADRAAALARKVQSARTFERIDEAVRDMAVDVVHVCTPLAMHESVARAALVAGCHVLVEKPLTTDLASAEALLSLAVERRLLLCPVHQFLFQRGAIEAARELERIGPLRHLEMAVCSVGADMQPDLRDQVALEILPHALAFAARFCRDSMGYADWFCERPAEGELIVIATVGDVAVSARISMRGRPPSNQLRLVAERGTIHIDLFHGFAVVDRSRASKAMKIAGPFIHSARLVAAAAGNLAVRTMRSERAYPGLRELVRRFYAAASGGLPAPIAPEETRRVMGAWDIIRRQLASPPSPNRALAKVMAE